MDTIEISTELAEKIIERIEAIMYNSWENANTMLKEEAYYERYYQEEIEILSKLKEQLQDQGK